MEQTKKFNEIDGVKRIIVAYCKDCDVQIARPKQLCETCRVKRLKEHRTTSYNKKREQRKCKVCSEFLPLNCSNSAKYCSDKCRPNKQVMNNSLRRGERKAITRGKEKSKSGIDKFWLERGEISSVGNYGSYSYTN